ncbi:molybdate ABC transporter ATP-binding protein ModF [Marinobacterium rhizophilum]|uniref:molybdate ABC transporter ATP-binding protein ModF n=1 Tax=Marinobacterium rhizophilum TaxID=420402 RepID=UPI00036F75C3|nr:molybdate ABC transporter ATP-binding protein ModF [Marinobacterium rhizophilum]
MTIRLEDLTVNFDERFQLNNINWQIEDNQHWVVTGANGSGKSALAAVLAGAGNCVGGQLSGVPPRVGLVSFEAQAALIEAELKKDDADIMDVIAEGTPVREILLNGETDPALVAELASLFGLESLLDQPFRKLSTGESRKMLLVRALASQPDLLVLDEPFDGLDVHTLAMLQQYLATLVETTPMVLVLNRFDEFPDFITHIAYVDKGRLEHQVDRNDASAYADLYQLLHLKTTDLQVPGADPDAAIAALDPTQPLVKLNGINIKYGDRELIKDLHWTIERNQHWQLSGPNGSGKTGLLSLITGDHPQCYVNDIFVFGFQRGSGESIWQIKQYIGYVSTALQWDYRVGTGLRNVIISGFYDSIGLYTKSTKRQRQIADQWLALLGMSGRADQPFNKLSYGDQRLLLIARAMVKHPPLLILDEPCLGLDDMNRQLVLALIEKICAGTETSVIYVNHHPEDQIQGIDNYLALEAAK